MMREEFAQRHAVLPARFKLPQRAEQRRVALEEGEAFALHQAGRRRLALEFAQLGFVIEEIELRRSAGHEEVDHAFRLRCEVRWTWGERMRRIDDRSAGCSPAAL